MNPRSMAALPTLSNGMNRRNSRSGGSVIVKTTSSRTTMTPDGRQSCANAITQLTTMRNSNATMAIQVSVSRISPSTLMRQLSALVEEAALDDACLVLGSDVDVGRREQEDLVGHPLDAPTQTEDQPSREVDQPLGVAVAHLGEVHDDRRAVAEVLADLPRLVVVARVQRGDAVGVRGRRLGCGRGRHRHPVDATRG